MRGTTGCWVVDKHGRVRIGSGTAAAAARVGPSPPDGLDARHLDGRDIGAKRIDEMKRVHAIATAGVGADVPMPVSKLSTDQDRRTLLMLLRQVALPIHFLHNSVCPVCYTIQTVQLSKGCGDMAQRHVWVQYH